MPTTAIPSPFLCPLTIIPTRGPPQGDGSCSCQPPHDPKPTTSTPLLVPPSPPSVPPGDGCVFLYDLMRQQDVVRPVLTLDANGMRKPVHSLAFNPRKPDLLATGDATGIQVRQRHGDPDAVPDVVCKAALCRWRYHRVLYAGVLSGGLAK